MGGSASKVSDDLSYYAGVWNSRDVKDSQTELFRRIVPDEGVDFTDTFKQNLLEGVFTSDKIQLPMLGSYNSNYLWRDMLVKTQIPLFSDSNYTVLHPLGEPGRDLGPGHASKVSHLMIVKHTKEGPITFNEMLPSTPSEVLDLEERLRVLNLVFSKLRENKPLHQCGQRVVDRAREMGVDGSSGIRDFFSLMITSLPEDVRTGRPGYKLLNAQGVDVANDAVAVKNIVNEVFADESLTGVALIQTPAHCSQLVSHIHGFLVPEVPECMKDTYVDCEEILKFKKENMVETIVDVIEEDDGAQLSRTTTHTAS